MANQHHLEILHQGAVKWNQWRYKQLEIIPDLRGAILNNANLSGINLSYAKLSYAKLIG